MTQPIDLEIMSFVQLINKRDEEIPFTGLWQSREYCLIGRGFPQSYGGCLHNYRVVLASVLPDPWHEECLASWQEALQRGSERVPPYGIACSSMHELSLNAFCL